MANSIQSQTSIRRTAVDGADQLSFGTTPAVAGTFDSRHTTTTSSERLQLKMLGYSEKDIITGETALYERAIKPTPADIIQELAGKRVDITSAFHIIKEAMDKTLGFRNQSQMVKDVARFAESLKKSLDKKIDEHLTSAWPEQQKVAEIVSNWPEFLKESATYIRYGWPVLAIGDDQQFLCDFGSATEVCTHYCESYPGAHPRIFPGLANLHYHSFDPKYYKNYSPEVYQRRFGEFAQQVQELVNNPPPDFPKIDECSFLEYPVFFRLVKDIWLDALSTNNTGTMERVSHLMVSYTKVLHKMSEYRSKPKHHDSLDDQLSSAHAHKLGYEDLLVLAFQLATAPDKWEENYKDIFQQLISLELSSEESELMRCYDQWTEGPVQQMKVSHWAESLFIPKTIKTLHFLQDIINYINQPREDLRGGPRSVSNSFEWNDRDYFDADTRQLLKPIIAKDLGNLGPLEETQKVLDAFFSNKVPKLA
ncbi:hypothetical protein J7438_09640 [Thalassotalea sp. G20_0]|uniref:hypothetical protein n=1 Tax=Thalassotalea sp. G20_0 TaxID=2821093 RepID=UPI001AD99E31|nr:hypothetical protein [Thalassotalea sp. G20_0]MBO9494345.1 hypothetical protein [Thalassotalea sp. G20_0]